VMKVSYGVAHNVYLMACITGIPLTLFWCLRDLGKSREVACSVALAGCGLLMLFQCENWFMSWDGLDIHIMILLGYASVANKGWRWMCGLMALALLNRETALYIPLFMGLSSVRGVDPRRWDWRKAFVAVAMMAVGAGLITLIRNAMWHKPPHVGNLGDQVGDQIFWHFNHVKWITHQGLWYGVMLMTILAVLLSKKRWAVAGTYAFIVTTCVFFGFYNETRVYFAPVFFALIPCLTESKGGQRE